MNVVGPLIPLVMWYVMFLVPFFFLLPKIGMSRWWMLFIILPILGGIILLWIVSFTALPERRTTPEVFA